MIEKEDPGIAWIREVRHKISAEFGHDTKRMVDHYINSQKKYGKGLEPVTKRDENPTAEVVTI